MNVHKLVGVPLILLLVILYSDITLCNVYYIVPTDSEPCFVDPCLTLSQFAGNLTNFKPDYIHSNITLFIVGGSHDLDKRISLSNVKVFSMLSINDSVVSSVIACSTDTAHFSLTYSNLVHVHGIEFVGCNGNIFKMVGQASVVNSRFVNSSRTSLTILNSRVTMESTFFISNTMGKYQNELKSFGYLQMIFGIENSVALSVGGALIVTNSTLVCDFCQFNGNCANAGGAIFSESGSNITIRNSTFTSNHALGYRKSFYFGGALYIDGTVDTTTTMIYNSSFQNNTSNQYGGVAVVVKTSHVSYDVFNATIDKPNDSYGDISLSVEASTFLNNRAMYGGTVYLYKSNTAIYDCTFQHNKAVIMGGVIASNASSFVLLESSHFAFNEAKRDGGVVSIHQYSGVHVDTCVVEHNSVHSCGGAVFTELNSRAVFESSKFINNSADGGRGGVAMITANSTARINDSSFSNNSANSGGVLYVQMTTHILQNCRSRYGDISLSVEASTFLNNRAMYGGTVYLYNSNTAIYDCTFQHNKAVIMGGVIASNASSFVLLESSHFAFNEAKRDGGVVSIHQYSEVHVDTCVVEHNSVHSCGGAVFTELNSRAVFESSKFINNSADGGRGGVAMITANSTARINDSSFSNNSANSGGVLYVQIISSVSVQSSCLVNNKADHDGAVAFLFGRSNITVIEGNFIHNEAGMEGGGIKARNWSSVTIRNSMFSHNLASVYGGAIHIKDSTIARINDSQFDHNSAIDGGAINAYSVCVIKIYRSNFSDNMANITGGVISSKLDSNSSIISSRFCSNIARDIGAVVYSEDRTNITLDRSFFTNNSAIYGGVVAIRRTCTLRVSDSEVDLNIARADGGFLYSHSNCEAVINNSSFRNNKARNNGIVLAFGASNITIDTSNFTENMVGHDGAVAYVHDRSSAIINSCNIITNQANNSGGVVYTRRHCNVNISSGTFHNNTAENSGGVVCAHGDSKVNIEGSTFTGNKADYGGVVRMYIRSKINITDCHFSNNHANIGGGIVATYKHSIVAVQSSQFTHNTASYGGVLIAYQSSNVTFDNVSCLGNTAKSGGVIRTVQESTMNVIGCDFSYNTAELGGVLCTQHGVLNVENCNLEHNRARLNGGAIYTDDGSTTSIYTVTFSNNTAENNGGTIALLNSSITILDGSSFTSNRANTYGGTMNLQNSSVNIFDAVFNYSIAKSSGGVVCAKDSSISISACFFTYNNASRKGGALDVHMNSNLTVLNSTFMYNTASESGGALCLTDTSKSIIDDSVFHYNKAKEYGGAIFASTKAIVNITRSNIGQNTANKGAGLAVIQNSSVSFDSSATNTNTVTFDKGNQVCENMASINGGGVLLFESILYFTVNTTICRNEASAFGGGVSAFNSYIMIGSSVLFDSNRAMQGGGASLAMSKLYRITADDNETKFDIKFVKNNASDGGALYVDDKRDTCTSGQGCFFQNVTKGLQILFNSNVAEHRGHNLFGGLLDRCTAVSDATPKPSGIVRFKEISNIRNLSTVTSEPVRVCICKNSIPSCSQQMHNISVKQGNTFTIQLSAVDQVNQSISATIQSKLKDVSLAKNQTIRRIDSSCSDLDYQVFFPSVSEVYQLTINAEGPCNSIGISNLTVDIKVLECLCAPGFMREDLNTKCLCVCDRQDKVFSTYIKECNFSIESIIRKGLFWITYLNNSESDDNSSSRYFIYPYCPLGYCQSPSKSVPVNLKHPNGSDAQCANNRVGILCGRCRPNFSLSLGSSKCISCPKNWYVLFAAIIIAAFFTGIILVFILLLFNLTVAVGTINSIIFYANIIYANKSIFFNHWQLQLTFASVFVSWLNLDIGFDVCFFDGMNVYVKTWLQLAFSVYIFILVIITIWISSYSSRLSNLLGKRNPVAALATLILLSYTKLLEAIIKSFSFVSLNYPNGTTTTNWLPDPNMEYSEWKLILLLCSATVILIFGLLYTILIFSWQWLLQYSRSKLFKWVGNQKLHLFIDTYHIPHTTKHRYWIGLLLLVRVIIYLISAFSASINPRITLLSTATVICCVFLYKTALMIRVYKNWLLNAMESFAFFNIVIFVFFTWYTFDDPGNTNKEFLQTVAAYFSVGAMLFLFLLVILFHVYRYGNARVYALLQNTKLIRKIRHQMSFAHNENQYTSSHGNIYRLFDVIDNPRDDNNDADGSDYASPFVQLPTRSTVSLTDCDEPLITESHPSQKESSISTF